MKSGKVSTGVTIEFTSKEIRKGILKHNLMCSPIFKGGVKENETERESIAIVL